MNPFKYEPDESIIADIMKRIEQIASDTGYGKINIYIVNNEVNRIEHTVTKVFKSVTK